MIPGDRNAGRMNLRKAGVKAQIEGKKVFENTLESVYLYNEYESDENKKEKCNRIKAALKAVAGDNAVLTSGKKALNDFVSKKGFTPITLEPNWFQALEKYGIPTENQVLEGLEKDGMVVSDPTPDMILAVDRVWNLVEKYDMTNGRKKPPVKAFSSIMSGESTTRGLYDKGIVYLHTDSPTMSPLLLKAVVEEVSHHTTGSGDLSRDFQDYLIRLLVKIAFEERAMPLGVEYEYFGAD